MDYGLAGFALGILNSIWAVWRYFHTDQYVAWGVQLDAGQDCFVARNGGSAPAYAVRMHIRTPEGHLGTVGREQSVVAAGEVVTFGPGAAMPREQAPEYAITWKRRPTRARGRMLLAENTGAMDLRFYKPTSKWRVRLGSAIAGRS